MYCTPKWVSATLSTSLWRYLVSPCVICMELKVPATRWLFQVSRGYWKACSRFSDSCGSRRDNIGKFSKKVDVALPGKHTRLLYDGSYRREVSVLAQIRTGMARLNGYLFWIKVSASQQCACTQATMTVKHFLFRCRTWAAHRSEMLQCSKILRGNFSFCLGIKSPSDNAKRMPNMQAVHKTIRFAIATGRLDTQDWGQTARISLTHPH